MRPASALRRGRQPSNSEALVAFHTTMIPAGAQSDVNNQKIIFFLIGIVTQRFSFVQHGAHAFEIMKIIDAWIVTVVYP
jgi:hypothetical protein